MISESIRIGENGMDKESEQQMVDRLELMFKQLDRSGNGRIDIQDLTAALKEFGMSMQYAEVR